MTPHEKVHGETTAETGRIVHDVIHALTTMRRQHDLTCAQLATRLAITETTVRAWETGAGHPTTTKLLAWANALDCVLRAVEKSAIRSSLTQWRTHQQTDHLALYRPLAQTLHTARTTADLRQQDVANRLGVSRGTICQWESAHRIPRLTHLTTWAHTVGCRLELNAWNPTPTAGRTTARQNLIPQTTNNSRPTDATAQPLSSTAVE